MWQHITMDRPTETIQKVYLLVLTRSSTIDPWTQRITATRISRRRSSTAREKQAVHWHIWSGHRKLLNDQKGGIDNNIYKKKQLTERCLTPFQLPKEYDAAGYNSSVDKTTCGQNITRLEDAGKGVKIKKKKLKICWIIRIRWSSGSMSRNNTWKPTQNLHIANYLNRRKLTGKLFQVEISW